MNPRAVFAAVQIGDGAVVQIPLVNRILTLVGRTHVEQYRIVGADVGTRIRVDVNHHAVLLDNLDDDDVRPYFIGRRTGFVARQAATDVAEVGQVGGRKDGVGGTGDIAAVNRPLVARMLAAILRFGNEAGFHVTAFGYHRGVGGRITYTVNRNLRRYGVTDMNRYRIVGRADRTVGARAAHGQRKARGGIGRYIPIFQVRGGIGMQIMPQEAVVVVALERQVRPLLRRGTLTNHGVVAERQFGFNLDFDRSRIETAVDVNRGYGVGLLMPYRHVHIGRRFAGVQPVVRYNARAGGLELNGLGAARKQFGSRYLGIRFLNGGIERGVDRAVFGAHIGAGHDATDGIARMEAVEFQRVAGLAADFHIVVIPRKRGRNVDMVGHGHELRRRAGAKRFGLDKGQRQVERGAEANLGHGRGVGLATVGMVDNGAVVNRHIGFVAADNTRIAAERSGLPSNAVTAFFPFDDIEVRRFGQVERIGLVVADAVLDGGQRAGRGLGIEAQQYHVARAVAYTVVGHAANVGRIVGKRRQRIILAVVRRGQCRPVVARLGVLVFPTVGVLVGHAAKYVQTREVGAVIVVAAHLLDVGQYLVVVNRRVRRYIDRRGVSARTYAVAYERTEIERVFNRHLDGRALVAASEHPAVQIAGIGVHLPLYLVAAVTRYVEQQLGIGAEVGGRINRGRTANGRHIHLNRMFARNRRVGFGIGERKAVNRGLRRTDFERQIVGGAKHRSRIAAYHAPSEGVVAATALRQGFQRGAVAQADGRFFRQLIATYGQLAARRDDDHFVGARTAVGVGYGQRHLRGLEERARDNRHRDVGDFLRRVEEVSARMPFVGIRRYRLTNPATAQNLRAAAFNPHIRTRIHLGRRQTVYRNGLRNGHFRRYAFFGRFHFGVDDEATRIRQLVGGESGTVVARNGRAVDIPAVFRIVAGVFARNVEYQTRFAANRVDVVVVVDGGRMVAVEEAGAYMRGGRGRTAELIGNDYRIDGFGRMVRIYRLGGVAR